MEDRTLHRHPEEERYEGYDPIIKSRVEGDRFTRLWLRDGERMTRLQRVGYGFISFLHLVGGLSFAHWYWLSIRERDLFSSPFSGTLAVCISALGVIGLSNALKFRGKR